MNPQIAAVEARMLQAHDRYGLPSSASESLGVIAEEFHELIEAVRSNKRRSIEWEALDLAAACLRLADACTLPPGEPFCLRSGFHRVTP